MTIPGGYGQGNAYGWGNGSGFGQNGNYGNGNGNNGNQDGRLNFTASDNQGLAQSLTATLSNSVSNVVGNSSAAYGGLSGILADSVGGAGFGATADTVVASGGLWTGGTDNGLPFLGSAAATVLGAAHSPGLAGDANETLQGASAGSALVTLGTSNPGAADAASAMGQGTPAGGQITLSDHATVSFVGLGGLAPGAAQVLVPHSLN